MLGELLVGAAQRILEPEAKGRRWMDGHTYLIRYREKRALSARRAFDQPCDRRSDGRIDRVTACARGSGNGVRSQHRDTVENHNVVSRGPNGRGDICGGLESLPCRRPTGAMFR